MAMKLVEPQQGQGGNGSRSWPEVTAGMVVSICFHGVIVALALAMALFADDVEPEEEDDTYELVFDDVELLALGEERDPDMMPRLAGDEGAPPEVDEEVEAVAEEPVEPVAEADVEPELEPEREPETPEEEEEPAVDPEELRRQEEAEQARQAEEERRRRRDRARQALGQFEAEGRGDEAPEGSADGIAGGTATDGDPADTYQARVINELEERWQIPSIITDADLAQLAGRIRVQISLDDEGHITEFRFAQRSEHRQFDDSVERVLREFMADRGGAQLPLPEDDELRRAIINQGMTLSNWESIERR